MDNESFFDIHRGRFIQSAPEEKVRQSILMRMITEFGFPKGYLSVERAVHEFVENPEGIPNRRLDIVAFYKHKGTLFPLLIVECKAVPLREKMLDQIFGYNYFIHAPFIALVNQQKTIFGSYDTRNNAYSLSQGFRSYESLLKKIASAT